MTAQRCDLCDAPIEGCAQFGTWCLCGLYVEACKPCVQRLGESVKGRARLAHEQRHVTEVGR